MGLIDSWFI